MASQQGRNPFYSHYKWNISNYFDGSNPNIVALCKAIERNDLESVKSLIHKIDNINYLGKDNMNVLFWALPASDEIFETLIMAGADPCITVSIPPEPYTFFGDSVLYITVVDPNFLPPVNWILQKKQRKKYNPNYESQLFRLKLQLNKGANPNFVSKLTGCSLLTAACSKGGNNIYNCIQILLENGANPNLRDNNKNYPLDCTQGMARQTLLLLQSGAKVSIASMQNKNDAIMKYICSKIAISKNPPIMRSIENILEEDRLFDNWLFEHGLDIKSLDFSIFEGDNVNELCKIPPEERPWLIPLIENEKENE